MQQRRALRGLVARARRPSSTGSRANGSRKTFGGAGATDNNREHPPLMKTLFGLSQKLLHDKLGLVDEVTAYRLPAAILARRPACCSSTRWCSRCGASPRRSSPALLVMLLPRALFHAGLACFDAPIMTLWFATIYAYWRCLDGRAVAVAGRA